MACGGQKLKHPFPGALGYTSGKRDRHEGELEHTITDLLTVPMFGESISTIILEYQQRDMS